MQNKSWPKLIYDEWEKMQKKLPDINMAPFISNKMISSSVNIYKICERVKNIMKLLDKDAVCIHYMTELHLIMNPINSFQIFLEYYIFTLFLNSCSEIFKKEKISKNEKYKVLLDFCRNLIIHEELDWRPEKLISSFYILENEFRVKDLSKFELVRDLEGKILDNNISYDSVTYIRPINAKPSFLKISSFSYIDNYDKNFFEILLGFSPTFLIKEEFIIKFVISWTMELILDFFNFVLTQIETFTEKTVKKSNEFKKEWTMSKEKS